MPVRPLIFLGLILPAGIAAAATYEQGDPISIKGVEHTDPHRGTTYLRDATFTILGYEEHASVANQLFTTSQHDIRAQGKFVVVRYRVENHAGDTLDSYPVFFGGCTLRDASGKAHPVSKVSGQFAQAMKLDMQGKRMPPGQSITSCVAFDIPADASPSSIRLDLIDADVSLKPAKATEKEAR